MVVVELMMMMGLEAGGTILTFHQVSDFEECWNRRWHSSAASGKLGDDQQQAMQGEAGQGRETRRGGLLQVPVVSATTNNNNIEFLLVVINVIVINTHIIQPGSKKLHSVLNVILNSKC